MSGQPIVQVPVVLRPTCPSDINAMLAWRSEEAARRHQPLKNLTRAELLADLQHLATARLSDRNRDRYQWIVEAGEMVGWVTLIVRSWEHLVAEVAYNLGASFHGRGIGTRAITRLVALAFEEGGFYRLEARCSVNNPASYRLLERLGFTREGLMRDYFILHGQRVDHYLYSLLRPEWEARRELP